MLYFWITLGVLDALIIFFFILLCLISLRRSPNDIRNQEFRPGSQLDRLQKEIFKEELFFKNHNYTLLTIQANGATLVAKRYAQKNPVGRILLFHGYRSIAETDFACAMDTYYQLGYELILVDQRAHGQSFGNWIGFGVLERYDCLSWIRYLNAEFGSIPTFLSGISMGCATALMAQGLDLPKNVKAIIADCPYGNALDIILEVGKSMPIPTWIMKPMVILGARIFGGFDLLETDAVRAVKHTKVPILIIHGDGDTFVPISMSKAVADANPQMITHHTIAGAEHGISYLVDTVKYKKYVADFMASLPK
jgi:pimeloyl-ACP methyl ester carboxylesterase